MVTKTVKINLSKYMRENFALPTGNTSEALKKVIGEESWQTEYEYRWRVNVWAIETARKVLEDSGWVATFEDSDRYTHPSYSVQSPRGTGGSRSRSSKVKSYSVSAAIRACGKTEFTVEL